MVKIHHFGCTNIFGKEKKIYYYLDTKLFTENKKFWKTIKPSFSEKYVKNGEKIISKTGKWTLFDFMLE